jgi:lysophospholipid acyltransferase 5
MIGPQFPLRRYFDFVEGKFSNDDNPPRSIAPGLQRLVIGLTYVGIYQLGSQLVNNEYVTSPSYQALPLWQRLLVVGLYGRVMLYKYVSCWIVSEGACIMSGISYNGKDSKGEPLWDGCENVQIAVFEKAYKFAHLIASFNKCTNQWVAQNVYKRLKFVGNRYVSQGASLLFLAVWHGLHSGYYVCFLMEFIVMKMEKDLERMLSKNPRIQRWHNSPIGFWIDVVICKIVVTIFFGYCTLPFGLLKLHRWWEVYKDLYFIGCIIFGLWPLYAPLVKAIIVPRESRRVTGKENEKNGAGERPLQASNGLKVD